MKYKVVVFGVKDTSENIVSFIQEHICPVDLVVTISPEVTKKNQVSGYKGLSGLTEKYGIPVHEADSYFLTDEKRRNSSQRTNLISAFPWAGSALFRSRC